MKKIGEKTQYGIIVAIGWVGERYYWLKDKGTIWMLPADVIEMSSEKGEGCALSI